MRVKICGITNPDQAPAIAELGATALGFMCVRQSPRYQTALQIRAMVERLLASPVGQLVDRVGVFANATLEEIVQVVRTGHLTAVQLHGAESPQFCRDLRAALPGVELIKALRVRDSATLEQLSIYYGAIDTLLLDAYHPTVLGGTGKTLDWANLQQFRPECPWLLAGGLTPENVLAALHLTQPDGIDLSSGVELAPGDKDLQKVAQLFEQLRRRVSPSQSA